MLHGQRRGRAGRPARAAYSQNFFAANQAALQHPELLIDVHGIDPATDVREARALVYLNLLLDGFAVANGRVYRRDFAEMARVMELEGDSLRRFLAIPANVARWDLLKERAYGDFNPDFIAAVDRLIAFEADLSSRRKSLP
jgi:hypothetical protein